MYNMTLYNPLDKSHNILVSKIVLLHNLEKIIIARSVYQRMLHTKEVVKLKLL